MCIRDSWYVSNGDGGDNVENDCDTIDREIIIKGRTTDLQLCATCYL